MSTFAIVSIKQKGTIPSFNEVTDNDLIHDSDSLYGYNGVSDFGTAENYNLRKTMSNNAIKNIQRYNIDIIMQKWDTLFKEILKNNEKGLFSN